MPYSHPPDYERIRHGFAKGEDVDLTKYLPGQPLVVGARGQVIRPRNLTVVGAGFENRVLVEFETDFGRSIRIDVREDALRAVFRERRRS